MPAEARAILIKDLRDVVKGHESDRNKSALVVQKYDARKDLAGKIKSQIINLLFEDVKFVVTDPGTQYQISSIFS